jgi:hypothetical protein
MSKEQVDNAVAQMFLEYAEAREREAVLIRQIAKVGTYLENTANALRTKPTSLNFTEDALGSVQNLNTLVEDLKRAEQEKAELWAGLVNAGKAHLFNNG